MDKATADWLNQQYTSGNTAETKKEVSQYSVYGEDSSGALKLEKIRLAADSIHKIIGDPAILDTLEFDVLAIKTNEECIDVVHYLFDIKFDFFEEFKIPHDVFKNFLLVLSKKYINTNTYHNFKHAVDVCHTSYRLMMTAELQTVATGGSGSFSILEILSLLVAALGHDVGHPAVNNSFLVKSKHTLAFQHNDKSPLENMHCVVLYEILTQNGTSDPRTNSNRRISGSVDENSYSSRNANIGTNIFINLTDAQWRESRKVILFSILGTDMVHHFEQVKKTAVSICWICIYYLLLCSMYYIAI